MFLSRPFPFSLWIGFGPSVTVPFVCYTSSHRTLFLSLAAHSSINPSLTDLLQAAWRDGHRAASSFAPTSPTSNNVDQEQTRALAAVRAVYSRLVRALRAKVVFPPGVEGGGWMKDQVDRFKT